ncbi:MAG: hypothetical protein EOP53_25685 [Sphingobacteriales bacterium]|nr:MAG: hypothetical protein EOP53_25685 [Sphingobacteriales bacterium]
MKQFFIGTIFFAFAGTATMAQTGSVAKNIKASVIENNLVVTWNEANASETGSWEVQGSADGKSFSTIGLVWGADPKGNRNGYAFKQTANKVQSKYQYFRVMYVANSNTAETSNTIRISK